MQTIKLKGRVDEERKLSLTLPPKPADGSFAELMAFHKGRRLDGVSLKELVAEGRR